MADVAGWEAYNLRDLAHDSWVGSVVRTEPAQHLAAAGSDLDDVGANGDVSDVVTSSGSIWHA